MARAPPVPPTPCAGLLLGRPLNAIVCTPCCFIRAAKIEQVNTSTPLLTKEQLSQWDEAVPLSPEKFPLVFPSGSINILNNAGPHDSETPLQFLYEAAECRRSFTLSNILNQETVWGSVADAMFDGGACVPGSTNATGSLFA